jgi:hypothetical protein
LGIAERYYRAFYYAVSLLRVATTYVSTSWHKLGDQLNHGFNFSLLAKTAILNSDLAGLNLITLSPYLIGARQSGGNFCRSKQSEMLRRNQYEQRSPKHTFSVFHPCRQALPIAALFMQHCKLSETMGME